jgi:hypothetical protein
MQTAIHLRSSSDCYRVDRATALGNPFDLPSEAQRLTVIRAHKEYLWLVVSREFEPVSAAEQIGRKYGLPISPKWRRPSRAAFMAALSKARCAERLGCWCAPKPCHADNYVALFGWLEKVDMNWLIEGVLNLKEIEGHHENLS